MKINDFFRFSSHFDPKTVQAHAENLKRRDEASGKWDIYRLVTGDYDSMSFPVTFRQKYGSKYHDVIDTGTASLFLISDRMRFVLEENNLTGWKYFPIVILDKNGKEVRGYQGLSVTGRCGAIDNSKAQMIYKRLVPGGPVTEFLKGVYIGLDEWDGSDFFLPENNYGTIITKKAAEIMTSNKLTNIHLQNLADVEVMSPKA